LVPSGRLIQSCSRRTGNCQHTSGLYFSGCTPSRSAWAWSAQPPPPTKSVSFRKTQGPSLVCTAVRRAGFDPSMVSISV
jgi:hypothetical protein